MSNLMPKPRDDETRITDLLKKLAADGISVVDAELQLAKGEAARLMKQYVISLAICIFCFVLAISAVTILAQAGVMAITPYFMNPAYAYLSVGFVLLALTIGLLFIATTIATRKHRPVGLVSKWLAGHGSAK
jgi:TRAP-type C4-dicarboxylate transport system permease small subunit